MTKKRRFDVLEIEGALMTGGTTKILLDTETGVQYLFHQSGYSGGLCPLLNPDGTLQLADISDKE